MAEAQQPELQVERLLGEVKAPWGKTVISSLFSGCVAVCAAPTIAALVPIGTVGFLVSAAATGVIGSVTSKVARNVTQADQRFVVYSPYASQARFRTAVLQHLEGCLNTVLNCIQHNTNGVFKGRVKLDLADDLSFLKLLAQDQGEVYIEYNFKVSPRPGTLPRPLKEGKPPDNLPQYHENATARYRVGEDAGFLDGITWAFAEGAAFGCVGGALGAAFPALQQMRVVETVKGKVGLLYGVQSATGAAGPAKDLAMPASQLDRTASYIEFLAEVGEHISRVVRCANANGVGLAYKVVLRVRRQVGVGVGEGPDQMQGAANKDMVFETWEAVVGTS